MTVECRLLLAGILVFAGCASAPRQPVQDPAAPAAEVQSIAQASGAATATASAAEGAASDKVAAAPTERVREIEVAKLADTNPVTCRDLLIQGSNVLHTQCMTRNDWKVWDQAERIWAQDMLLRMQGFKR